MSDAVLWEQRGHVAVVTLNRPERRNPISDPEMLDGLVSALRRAGDDQAVRAVILTAGGTAFSAGGNVRLMAEVLEQRRSDPLLTPVQYEQGIQRIPLAFEALDVPVIAAVNGPAIGAGCDLVCLCDIRIAAESARFAESFVKMGLVPGDGGAWLLPRAVGYAKACEMAFTGELIAAAEALAFGLVSRVVPDGELLDQAMDLANRIAANPPHAVRLTKRLLMEGRTAGLAEVLRASALAQALAQSSRDHGEAVTAFLEKREPVFRGS